MQIGKRRIERRSIFTWSLGWVKSIMMTINRSQDRVRLRRMALSAQGLLHSQPFGRGLAGARQAIQHIGYVQIDTISVVERAHHHVLYSRVPDFEIGMIDQLLLDRAIFEYWSHAAAFLPMTDFRFSLPYKHAIKSGQTHWYRTRDQKLMNELLARIRSDGAIRSRDVESNQSKSTGWWDWKPAKRALEQLYMEGDLMVSHREGFQKVYDLTERVLPADVDARMPTMPEFAEYMIDQQLGCHGVVSLKGLSYLRRSTALRVAIKNAVNERLAQRTLEQIRLSSGEVLIASTGTFERPLPKVGNRMRILSPFDNSVIQRDRLKALFDYDYQLECYVPEAKRQYGYFCLPLIYRDAFVGRVDCKAHRKERCLEIKALYFETHGLDDDALIFAFVEAISEFARFQRCECIALGKVQPPHLAEPLRVALKLCPL